jgi:hypothetical protein
MREPRTKTRDARVVEPAVDLDPELSEPLYPVTILMTRYGGVYEGGAWAAFPLYPVKVPSEAFADDVTCATWWEEFAHAVGVGETPDAALADLESKSAHAGPRTPYRLRPDSHDR